MANLFTDIPEKEPISFYKGETIVWKRTDIGADYDPSRKSSLISFVSIPFFQDSGFEINNLPVKMAEIAVDRAGWSTRLTRLNLLKQIASIYWDMVGIYESIEVQKKSVVLSKQLLNDNKAIIVINIFLFIILNILEVTLQIYDKM